MGICYTYLLYDDFDWDYVNKTKEQTIEELKKQYPVATVLAQWSNWIVVDMDKLSVYKKEIQDLQDFCDQAYYITDQCSGIKELKFERKPIDTQVIQTKETNIKLAEQSNASWLQQLTSK